MSLLDKSPDHGWLPFLKLIIGFVLVTELGILAVIIALGKVEQATSHGLDTVLGCLITLSGGFSYWAFQNKTSPPSDKEDLPDSSNL